MPLHQLFYVSRATQPYDDDSIQDILRASRRNNPSLDVTGCLLFSGLHFAQVLEGEAAVIDALAARIAVDPRHTGLRLLVERGVAQRAYGGWSMAYLSDLDLEDELSRLLVDPFSSPDSLARTMGRMTVDPTLGALA